MQVARQLQSISPDQLAQMFEFMAGPFLEAIEKVPAYSGYEGY
jgi:hypothetical protein